MTTSISSVAVRRFPTLTVSTPRFVIRPLAADDAGSMVGVFADRKARRWLPLPQAYGSPEAHAWCTRVADDRRERGEGDHYGVVRRADDQVIGGIWVRRTDWGAGCTELAFAILPETRGYGVAPEAVDAISIALLLEHGLQRVELRIAPGNLAARRVAEKAGFTYEGLLRNAGTLAGGRVDLEVWSLVSADLH
jgi:RimJ/RimL family protein N-acetyltransferase